MSSSLRFLIIAQGPCFQPSILNVLLCFFSFSLSEKNVCLYKNVTMLSFREILCSLRFINGEKKLTIRYYRQSSMHVWLCHRNCPLPLKCCDYRCAPTSAWHLHGYLGSKFYSSCLQACAANVKSLMRQQVSVLRMCHPGARETEPVLSICGPRVQTHMILFFQCMLFLWIENLSLILRNQLGIF